MRKNKDENLVERVSAYISHKQRDELMKLVFKMKIPINRLLAFALDQELSKEKPFGTYTYEVTEESAVEYSYIDQAQKILKYMLDADAGLGYDQLLLLRHDIGVPDRLEFALAFKECLDKEFIEGYHREKNPIQKTDFPDDYKFYRIKKNNPILKKKARKAASEFSKYQRLKKKYECE